MKKIFTLLFIIISLFSLTSCQEKEKVFTKGGITVTLTTSFIEFENEDFEVAYTSTKYGFAGTAQPRIDFIGYDLEDYANNVKSQVLNDGVATRIYQEKTVIFRYFYYDATVDGIEYSYMSVLKEGDANFYSMAFWTFKEDFDEAKEQFFEWAKLIVVE